MYLKKIIDYKKLELQSIRRKVSFKDVRLKAQDQEATRGFYEALRKDNSGPKSQNQKIKVIAEVKKASPSAGVIRADFDPVRIAVDYETHGATCLSVLTDENFFKGHLDYLQKIRKQVKIPLLRKDFVFDEYQIFEARAAGADAILLIVAILEPSQLRDYHAIAQELGLSVLVEVHEPKEVEPAVLAQAQLIGVNNRNLSTFEVSLDVSEELSHMIPIDVTKVSESGISKPEDIKRLLSHGYDAFLIGESFMREKEPGVALERLIELK